MKVAVMTDSTAYIPKSIREKLSIHMVPLNVVFDEESYREEMDLTTAEFYHKVKQSKKLPKTSQQSIGLITEKLIALKKTTMLLFLYIYPVVLVVHTNLS